MSHQARSRCLALAVPFTLTLALGSTPAHAEEPRADSVTHVALQSDWDGTVLVRHLGSSVGVGYAAGRSVTVTTAHLERVCRAPCSAELPTESTYVVDAPGMNTASFELPPGAKAADVRVKGASQLPLTLSGTAAFVGLLGGMVGGIFWGVGSASESDGRPSSMASDGRTVTFLGIGTLAVGIAGLIFFPKTHVDVRATEGAPKAPAADVKAQTATRPAVQLTPAGFVF